MNDIAANRALVADASDVTYYGLPAIKPSLWGGLVSSYMFLAGLGGSAQIIATAADLAGGSARASIVRNGRYLAFASAVVGGALLITDLHTPQRFYNMLRIFRKTSPMSIGTWVLMSFGSLSAALAAVQFAEDAGRASGRIAETATRVLQVCAALAGMPMTTYTGALLSATSTPLWAAAPCRIAALFGTSAMASGATALRVAGQSTSAHDSALRSLDRIALIADAVEFALLLSLRRRLRRQEVDAALRETVWGLAFDLRTAALGAGLPLLFKGNRPPKPMLIASLATLAGGFLWRHLLLRAGNTSAKQPKDYFRFAGSEAG